MNRIGRMLLVGAVTVMATAACSRSTGSKDDAGSNHPVTVERATGTAGARVTLTDKAIERIGLETAVVKDAASGSSGATLTIPNAAVLYDPTGKTWVYTSATHGTYVRTPIVIVRVTGDAALLSAGPPAGTEVVTTGAAELYGAESTFGED